MHICEQREGRQSRKSLLFSLIYKISILVSSESQLTYKNHAQTITQNKKRKTCIETQERQRQNERVPQNEYSTREADGEPYREKGAKMSVTSSLLLRGNVPITFTECPTYDDFQRDESAAATAMEGLQGEGNMPLLL